VFGTPTWKIIRYEVENTAVARPSTPGWREYEDLLRQTLRDMQTGGDVKAMLTDTAAKIDRQLLKYTKV
jgi:multiple sugar transport system substrate-binding protein